MIIIRVLIYTTLIVKNKFCPPMNYSVKKEKAKGKGKRKPKLPEE
jgi:hypothetical protein